MVGGLRSPLQKSKSSSDICIVASDVSADVTNARSPCGVFLLISRPADVKFLRQGSYLAQFGRKPC